MQLEQLAKLVPDEAQECNNQYVNSFIRFYRQCSYPLKIEQEEQIIILCEAVYIFLGI